MYILAIHSDWTAYLDGILTGRTAYPPYAGETVEGRAATKPGNLSNSLFGHTCVIITVQCMPGNIVHMQCIIVPGIHCIGPGIHCIMPGIHCIMPGIHCIGHGIHRNGKGPATVHCSRNIISSSIYTISYCNVMNIILPRIYICIVRGSADILH